jgi:hypothetical protein
MKRLLILITCALPMLLGAQAVPVQDVNFKKALINNGIDKNGNGEIEESEALLVKELNVQSKEITSLEGIASFKNLTSLNCISNKLSELDVSLNTCLTQLQCNYNELLTSDMSKNVNLTFLECSENELSVLDVSNQPELLNFNIRRNKLTTLDITKNKKLQYFNLLFNNLTQISTSKNLVIPTDFVKDTKTKWVKK